MVLALSPSLRWWFGLALAGACAGALPQEAGTPPVALDRSDVRARLLRMHDAASHRNFQGTFVVSAGRTMSSARIAHYCEGGNQFERIDTMDGQLRRVLRRNEVVHTLWPQSRVALVEHRELMGSFPALLRDGDDQVSSSYEMRSQGYERVADHEAEVLVLRPKDRQRYAQRLWAERGTGLLLRVEVLGEHDEVLESSAFSQVSIGVKPQPEVVTQPMNRLEGYRVLRPTLHATQLAAEGWSLDVPVSGFRQVQCVKRPFDADDGAGGHATEAVQSIYSDGLTSVSVFIEPFDPRRHAAFVQVATGATQTLSRRVGDAWITVVGDVPPTTLQAFATALQRVPAKPR